MEKLTIQPRREKKPVTLEQFQEISKAHKGSFFSEKLRLYKIIDDDLYGIPEPEEVNNKERG